MKQKNVSHVVDKGIEDLVVSYAFYGNSVLLNWYFLNLDWLGVQKVHLDEYMKIPGITLEIKFLILYRILHLKYS